MYHKVARIEARSLVKGHYVAPDLFSRQMRALRALRFQSVGLNHLFEPGQDLPKRPIAITFDDGYQNFFESALPELKKVGFESTVFLVANQLGGTNQWDALLGDVEEKLMSTETIRIAASQGVEFGSHTLDHVDLKLATRQEAVRQVAESKEILEAALGKEIFSFCYPYGRMNEETPEIVRSSGYRLACSTKKGTNTAQTDRYALRRINVRSDTWTPVLLLKLLRSARDGQ
jgi:peptidoglycan/xylan/chitin deacetylase (PgdA/CDA1 family)